MMLPRQAIRQDTSGPIHTVEFVHSTEITFASPHRFDDLTKGQSVQIGQFYAVCEVPAKEKKKILIRNLVKPTPDEIHRDNAWHRRRELDSLLSSFLRDGIDLTPSALHHGIPLGLLTPSYSEAFTSVVTEDDILRHFTVNSQRMIETIVDDYLADRQTYDTQAYSRQGVSHPSYSHIAHLGWVYSEQIRAVLRCLESNSECLTLLDMGTGSGHLLLTLAKHLKKLGLASRMRLIGIDQSERDMRFATELAKEIPDVAIAFGLEDMAHPNFADQMRSLQPDFAVLNHVLEHLEGELENRYLHDCLLAVRKGLSISVPLGDDPDSSLSTHCRSFSADSLERLGKSMEVRVGNSATAREIEKTKHAGLCTWIKEPIVQSDGGFNQGILTVVPKPGHVSAHPYYSQFQKPFDVSEYRVPRRAMSIGVIKDKATFSRQGEEPRQVRQFVIKMPGTPVRLPIEFEQCAEFIEIATGNNMSQNSDYEKSYVYLNLFRGLTNSSSYRGLSLNCHGDQMQAIDSPNPYQPDWSYIVSDTNPTMLYEQGFDLSEAVEGLQTGLRINPYDLFNKQASERHLYRSENYKILLLSPYIVHSAAPAEKQEFRVFMKIAVSRKRFFDNRELRRNPAFDTSAWYRSKTVGFIDGFFTHRHWNERFLKEDVCPKGD